jgi:cysteine desulfurase
LPVPLIVGFARAVEICLAELPAESQRLSGLRDQLWSQLASQLPDLRRNGHPERRLPGNLSVCFEGAPADAILVGLREVALSTGSACASGSGEPSHVLRALGLSDALARSAVRFGIGRGNTAEELAWVAERLIPLVRELRARRARPGPPRHRSASSP